MSVDSTERDLSNTKHELLKIKEMLEMAEKVTFFGIVVTWVLLLLWLLCSF